MSYFIDHFNDFVLEPPHKNGLRECQLGAIWALKSHFTSSSTEIASLISMPTGAGKTALMMGACFELKISKILIVVPSTVLRRQISEQFRSLNVLKEIGCIPSELPQVNVYEVVNRFSSRSEWEQISRDNDVIVAHPNSISPYFKNLTPIPKDLIDAVFVDEAHHEPAPTWKALNEYYSEIKRVFFTATPFRRDKRRMEAKLIYHYSLGRALDAMILRPVNFEGVNYGIDNNNSDKLLIQKAKEVYSLEKQINPNSSIIIRTDRIEEANDLADKYTHAGLKIGVVHSRLSDNSNAKIIQAVRTGELDGFVCVGIASEGLDIPSLKVAVLHATPKTIPYTLQFLGRISRQATGQIGSATLIANIDEVKGEVGKLYKSDKAWGKLLPQIIDQQIIQAPHYRSKLLSETSFQMPEINVFFSALVYETTEDFNYEDDFDTESGSPFNILLVEQQNEESPLIIITTYDKPVEWANRSIFIYDTLDIHIFYYNSESHLLFELTTSELALKSFKKKLIRANIKKLPHGKLYRTLSEFNQNNYIMVGLRNSSMRGLSHPSYKTLLGSNVQAAVRVSEGRVFSAGHALLRFDNENIWGIATSTGRVWAMKRGTIEEFQSWCDKLANLINFGNDISNLPGLSFLARSIAINSIDDCPIAIIPNDLFFRAYSIVIQIFGQEQLYNCIPIIYPIAFNKGTGVLKCELKLESQNFELIMNYQDSTLWTIHSNRAISIRADKNENDVIIDSLENVLNEYPPSLIMRDGSVIEGRNQIFPNRDLESLPDEIWITKDWTNCLITAERYQPRPISGSYPVINQTIDFILENFKGENDLLILDDGSHEIADLVWFQGIMKRINFIHCKASSRATAGCREKDSDVLYAQAIRSINWVCSPLLIERLKERLGRDGNTQLISGEQEILDEIFRSFKINDWDYNIILAQPGFLISQVSNKGRKNNNVYELTIAMYERILGGSANLEIWGS